MDRAAISTPDALHNPRLGGDFFALQ